MNGAWRRLLGSAIQSRNVSSQSHHLRRLGGDGPSETLKQKLAEMERRRRRRKKDEAVLVAVPESMKYLDTATLPMTLTFVAIAVAAKLLMMYEYDETRSQERIERQIKEAPKDQGTVRMLSREEWEEVREVRPRTPFESKLARPNARIRTGEPLRSEDVKDWTIDVLTDALTRVEESVRHGSS